MSRKMKSQKKKLILRTATPLLILAVFAMFWIPAKLGNTTAKEFHFLTREGRVSGVPGNSIYGIKASLDAGYEGMRVSVRETKDHVWVLSHDASINHEARNADGSELEEEILISETEYSRLNQYDYGIAYDPGYAGLGLTRLDDFLAAASAQGIELLLEMKAALNREQAESIAKLIVQYGYADTVWISAYEVPTLLLFQELLPNANMAVIEHFGEDALQTILDSGLISNSHRTRLDCYYIDTFDADLIQEFYKNGIDIKVGSAYSEEQVQQFLDLKIYYIEAANVVHPERLVK